MSGKEKALVSIVIPLFNRKILVGDTLVSLKAQSYIHWEALVVDDGSTDGSFEYIQKLAEKDTRIKPLKRIGEIKGAPVCRNIGIRHARGEFLIFLDSDDLLKSFCLERRVACFNKYPQLDFLVFPVLCFNQIPGDSSKLWNIDKDESDLSRMLNLDIPFITVSPIWRKTAIEKLGFWDERLLCWQDFDYHIRALIFGLAYKKINIEPDTFYRRGNEDKITYKKKEIKQIYSIVEICDSVYHYLADKNLLNDKYKIKVCELYLSVCVKFLKEQHFQGIRHVVLEMRRLQLINKFEASYLLFIMKLNYIMMRKGHKNIIGKLLHMIWRKTLFEYSIQKLPPRNITCQKISLEDVHFKEFKV